MSDARKTLIGIHPTGAKFYLEPYSNGKAGNRKFVIEGSRMAVPHSLEGMWVDTASAIRAFEAYLSAQRTKKAKPSVGAADAAEDDSSESSEETA